MEMCKPPGLFRKKQGCNLSAVFGQAQAGPNKGDKQGMGLVGAALEFGMELDTHIEGAVRELHGFHNVVIGGGAADDESRILKGLPEEIGRAHV